MIRGLITLVILWLKLFSDIVNEAEVVFENLIQVNENKGIFQYQYKVKQK